MSAQSHGTFGESTLRRIVEYEGPILSPFEIFGDCTSASRSEPYLASAAFSGRDERNPDHHHPKFLDPAERPYHPRGRLRRQRQGSRTPSLSPPQLAVARNFAVRGCCARGHRRSLVHAPACRPCGLEHAARKRPLGADLSQCAVPDCTT